MERDYVTKTNYEGKQADWAKSRMDAPNQCAQMAQAKRVTLPSLLEDVLKQASQLRAMTDQVANTVIGAVPRDTVPECQRGNSQTVMASVEEIRIQLREAIDNQQRTLNALAL